MLFFFALTSRHPPAKLAPLEKRRARARHVLNNMKKRYLNRLS
jgi:hypothetical protein